MFMYKFMHMYMYMYMYVCMHVCLYECMCTCVCVFARARVRACVCIRYHNVHIMVRQKIGSAVLTAMISEYMKATTETSSSRLATTLGLPPAFCTKSQRPSA